MRTFRQFITEAMTISTNGGGEGGGEGSSASLFVNPLPSLIPTDTPNWWDRPGIPIESGPLEGWYFDEDGNLHPPGTGETASDQWRRKPANPFGRGRSR